MLIKGVSAREVLDSRGMPTISVRLETNAGNFFASVPSGTSTGKYEALELRDGGKRFLGNGVSKAIDHINKKIAEKINYLSPHQKEIDDLLLSLDGTKNKSKLGANALLAVSMAVCRAGASEQGLTLYRYIQKLRGKKISEKITLPTPMLLVFEGGMHANKSCSFQELMIMPREGNFKEQLEKAAVVYQTTKRELEKNNYSSGVGLEGAFASPFTDEEKLFSFLSQLIKKAGYGKTDFLYALDIAASELKTGKNYLVNEKKLTKEALFAWYEKLIKKYSITSIEDGFEQDDWKAWRELTARMGNKLMIVGDDFLASNPARITKAINEKAANSLLLKINQIGTISEAIEAARLAHAAGWNIIVSHRSGETNDDFISDFAVGVGAQYVKFGAVRGGERVAKYNRLLEIDEELTSL